jgi:hypothetical protein
LIRLASLAAGLAFVPGFANTLLLVAGLRCGTGLGTVLTLAAAADA